MLIWRCKKCGWIGRDSDLGLHYGNDEEYCPRCKEVDSMEERCRWAMLYTSDAKIIR